MGLLRLRLLQMRAPALGRTSMDVLAQVTAGPADSIANWVTPPVVVQERTPPLPVGECSRPEIACCTDKITSDRKGCPRHAAVGAREDHLHAARRGVLAATVHDWAVRCNPDGADAGVAGGLRLRRSCEQQAARHRGRREGGQSSEGGGDLR